MLRFSSGWLFALDLRPAFQDERVIQTSVPVIFGADGKARRNAQMKGRTVLKADGKSVAVSVGGKQLQGGDGLASELTKTDKAPALKLPNGGFPFSLRDR